jgi:phosphate uptake regulator
MFKELASALDGSHANERMAALLDRILGHGQWMYEQAVDAWWYRRLWGPGQHAVCVRDRIVDNLTRSLRREIVGRLTARPDRAANTCLLLMSMAKDAERVGDYCTNLLQACRDFKGDFTAARYREPLKEIGESMVFLFGATRVACRNDDDKAGREAFARARAIGRQCDFLLESLLRQKEDEMDNREAVAYGLMSHFLKRIAAHLGNIASSTVAPLADPDFGDDGRTAVRGADRDGPQNARQSGKPSVVGHDS